MRLSRAAGVGIQYVIPALLVFYGRRTLAPLANIAANPHRYRRSALPHPHTAQLCVWAQRARGGGVRVGGGVHRAGEPRACGGGAEGVQVSLYLGLVYFPGLSSSSTDANPYCSD